MWNRRMPTVTARSLVLAVGMIVGTPLALSAQSLVRGTVQRRGRVVPDAVVQLIPVEQTSYPAVSDTALIDQVHLRFVPGVLAIQTGTTLQFRNSDPIMHNVFSPNRQGAQFNLGTYPQYESRPHTFSSPGRYVILCHVHPEMAAWITVVPTPYYETTDRNGAFRIRGVPPGSYRVQIWHRRTGTVERRAEVRAGVDTRLTIDLSSRSRL